MARAGTPREPPTPACGAATPPEPPGVPVPLCPVPVLPGGIGLHKNRGLTLCILRGIPAGVSGAVGPCQGGWRHPRGHHWCDGCLDAGLCWVLSAEPTWDQGRMVVPGPQCTQFSQCQGGTVLLPGCCSSLSWSQATVGLAQALRPLCCWGLPWGFARLPCTGPPTSSPWEPSFLCRALDELTTL